MLEEYARKQNPCLAKINDSLTNQIQNISNSDKIKYISKECGYKILFIHDSISIQIKNNRPICVQYGLEYGFTFDNAINELYKIAIEEQQKN